MIIQVCQVECCVDMQVHSVNDLERKWLSLPNRYGGMGLIDSFILAVCDTQALLGLQNHLLIFS